MLRVGLYKGAISGGLPDLECAEVGASRFTPSRSHTTSASLHYKRTDVKGKVSLLRQSRGEDAPVVNQRHCGPTSPLFFVLVSRFPFPSRSKK